MLLARLEAMRVRHMNASWKLTQLSQEEFQREKTFLRGSAALSGRQRPHWE